MNREQRERLAAARQFAAAQAAETAPQAASRPLPRRNGKLTDSVAAVLARADRPLRTPEIQHAVEAIIGAAVSANSLKDCLHRNARHPGSPIVRVAHGCYHHRPA